MVLSFHLLDLPPSAKAHPLSGCWQFWHVSRLFAKKAFLGSQVQEPGHCWVLCRRMVTLSLLGTSLWIWALKLILSWVSQSLSWNFICELLAFRPHFGHHASNLPLLPGCPCEKPLLISSDSPWNSLCIWIYANRLQEGSPNIQFLHSWFWISAWIKLSPLEYIISLLLLLDKSFWLGWKFLPANTVTKYEGCDLYVVR